ncbi:hypothetical protein GAYE_SCF64G6705 [Galdieria yellowstonensis]|uniref:HSF-type DNA-binding domain-containing protein n=1 Tax=Galdieria yellowstonensis TaxID=3028027 RepID=A0AAV9INB4_9RHOD|nr:hypothetical protein GAYE_SCF64G6705 [Galdieria yellowstonensis]
MGEEETSSLPTLSPPAQQTPAITPFLLKLYDVLESSSHSSLIQWTNGGDCFQVLKPTEFAHRVLPNYYKHNNFSSFVRQLNQYGFRKVDKEKWLFHHPYFKKGRKDLLSKIGRRKNSLRNKTAGKQASWMDVQQSSTSQTSLDRMSAGSWWNKEGEYVDKPMGTTWTTTTATPMEQDSRSVMDGIYRELISCKERQQKLSFLIQLDEHKLESLEKQLWCMKKWISEFAPHLWNGCHIVDRKSPEGGVSSSSSSSSHGGKPRQLVDSRLLPGRFDEILQLEQDDGISRGYPPKGSCPQRVELEPLSEQESVGEYKEWLWRLDGKGIDMSSLSGTSGGNSECSNELW